MAFVQKREIQFIVIFIVLMRIFGLSQETTLFMFPEDGEQVYNTINFYFITIIGLMVAISWLVDSHAIPAIPPIPPLWAVTVNFLIFFPISYIALSWLFTGGVVITIPTLSGFVKENVISVSENLIAFILLPALLPWGTGIGSWGTGKILSVKGYTLKYDIPNINRIKRAVPAIMIITFWHLGVYSKNFSTVNELIFAIGVVVSMFTFMYIIKEMFGFGASEAIHAAWNLVLVAVTGSVI